MKIAVTTSGTDLNAPFEARFGRAACFLIYDLEQSAFEIIDNQANAQAARGAGIQAAQSVCQRGAQVLLTGHCGPKAWDVLQAAGVEVFNIEATTVANALEQYNNGSLTPAGGANVQGHWS